MPVLTIFVLFTCLPSRLLVLCLQMVTRLLFARNIIAAADTSDRIRADPQQTLSVFVLSFCFHLI